MRVLWPKQPGRWFWATNQGDLSSRNSRKFKTWYTTLGQILWANLIPTIVTTKHARLIFIFDGRLTETGTRANLSFMTISYFQSLVNSSSLKLGTVDSGAGSKFSLFIQNRHEIQSVISKFSFYCAPLFDKSFCMLKALTQNLYLSDGMDQIK
jgi:hypothetical protein